MKCNAMRFKKTQSTKESDMTIDILWGRDE